MTEDALRNHIEVKIVLGVDALLPFSAKFFPGVYKHNYLIKPWSTLILIKDGNFALKFIEFMKLKFNLFGKVSIKSI